MEGSYKHLTGLSSGDAASLHIATHTDGPTSSRFKIDESEGIIHLNHRDPDDNVCATCDSHGAVDKTYAEARAIVAGEGWEPAE